MLIMKNGYENNRGKDSVELFIEDMVNTICLFLSVPFITLIIFTLYLQWYCF